MLGAFQHPLDSESTFSLESTLGALRPVWEQARQQGHDLAADNPTAAAFLDRVAAGNDRGREVTSLVKSIVQHYDKDGHRTTLTARSTAWKATPTKASRCSTLLVGLSCHRVGGEGSEFGPNLSDVGKRLRSEEILESILFPNKKLDPKYCATPNVLTVDGKAYSGLVVGETDELSLLVGQGTLQKIPQDQIDHREEVEVSSMPEHLHEGLSGIEFLDLLKFLAAQQTAPTARRNIGGRIRRAMTRADGASGWHANVI